MKNDTRLSGVLHILLHLADASGPVPSEVLARAMQTNPVVVRRIMAGLRERGHVRSGKGHGGGWRLARPLGEISLRDVCEALGDQTLLAIDHRSEAPSCLVEQAVNAALGRSFREAEAFLLARLGAITLETLSVDVQARLAQRLETDNTCPNTSP